MAPDSVFHGTTAQLAPIIAREGLRAHAGHVYLTSSPDLAWAHGAWAAGVAAAEGITSLLAWPEIVDGYAESCMMSTRSGRPENVARQLGLALIDARKRGVLFEDAWQPALDRVLGACAAGRERAEWRVALAATLETWRDAYGGATLAPSRRELALAMIGADRDMPIAA